MLRNLKTVSLKLILLELRSTQTNADVIATACPFCNTMMTDGVKNLEEGKTSVMDISELIAECL